MMSSVVSMCYGSLLLVRISWVASNPMRSHLLAREGFFNGKTKMKTKTNKAMVTPHVFF